MSNKIDILIRMANDIGNFFNAESDKELAANGIKIIFLDHGIQECVKPSSVTIKKMVQN